MKALIAAGGHATRLRPITHTINKHLIPLANRPMIEYAIEKVAECGITEVAINVNPGEREVQKAVGDGSRWGVNIICIEQQGGAKGIAHAIANASAWIGGDSFIYYLGDNIMLGSIRPLFDRFKREDLDCLLALSRVPDPQRFGVPEIRNGRIARVIEKPEHPPSDFAVTGIYFYKPCILRAVADLRPSERGEYEISDAHTWLINHAYNVGYEEITGWWKDTGKPEDLLHGNELLLDLIDRSEMGDGVRRENGTIVDGKAVIGQGTELGRGAVIRGPVNIGRNCVIKEATVGPYVSVGDNARIERSHVERSIIMEGTSIIDGHWISRSIFGRDVRAMPMVRSGERENRFILGDHSVVEW
jgi:glucose-1-phosphate thymidylyltransferase